MPPSQIAFDITTTPKLFLKVFNLFVILLANKSKTNYNSVMIAKGFSVQASIAIANRIVKTEP